MTLLSPIRTSSAGLRRREDLAIDQPVEPVREVRDVATGSSPDDDVPRAVRTLSTGDALEAAAAAGSALSIVMILHIVMNWHSWLGASIWFTIFFLVLYRLLVKELHGPIIATDRTMTVLITMGAFVSIAALLWLLLFVTKEGIGKLRPSFFTENMQAVGPRDSGGGAFHALVGTLEQVGIATTFSVPAAILTAVYLHEVKGRMAPLIRFFVDAMSGLPSIVAGLLVYTIWILRLGKGFSGIAGAMALAILMLPTITRTAEEILRTVPDTLREASLALGAPQWRVVLRTVIPTARSGLITAAILGVARAIGETAPLLLTASYTSSTNANPLNDRQASLPMFVYQLIRQPNENQVSRAWTGALVLLLTVLVLFVLARYIGARGARKRGG